MIGGQRVGCAVSRSVIGGQQSGCAVSRSMIGGRQAGWIVSRARIGQRAGQRFQCVGDQVTLLQLGYFLLKNLVSFSVLRNVSVN